MPPAFDATGPPDQDLLDACVHCGFCLPTCPTYLLWGEEMDSPRGRIVLMNEGLRPETAMSDEMVTHFDRCLGCMACVTACPSGVQYDRLIEAVRPQVERGGGRTAAERATRRGLLAAATRPGLVRALLPVAAAARSLGLTRMAARPGVRDRFPRIAALARLAPRGPAGAAGPSRPSVPPGDAGEGGSPCSRAASNAPRSLG